jgi:lipopolysaccharide export system protein LptA
MKPSVPLLLAAVLALAGASPLARAERADRQRPIQVEADRMSADDLRQQASFSGRVVVIQGTFLLCADQVTLRQDKDGNQNAIASGSLASFREKRDGSDEWIEGEAERIEYDTRNETLELFNRARVLRGRDEVRGNFIAYDARTEIVRVQDAKEAAGAPPRQGRVSAVFQPRGRNGDARSGAGAVAMPGLQTATEPGTGPAAGATGSVANRPATCRPAAQR